MSTQSKDKAKKPTKRRTRKTKKSEEGFEPMMLSGELRFEYQAAYYQVEAARGQQALHENVLREMHKNSAFQAAFKALSKRDVLTKQSEEALSRFRDVAGRVCKKLGISEEEFQKYAVDTETGRVIHIGDDNTDTPAKTE